MPTIVSYDTVNPAVVGTVDKVGGPLRRMAEVLANAMQGKLNIGGTATLNGTSMALTDPRIGAQSLLLFMPTTAAGRTAINGLYVSARGNGTATLNYPSATNVAVEYVVIG